MTRALLEDSLPSTDPPRTFDGALRWTPPNGTPRDSSPPPCPPRPLKPPPSLSSSSFSSSASHSSHSSSSSFSSHLSPSSSRSSCALSLPPHDQKEETDEEQVYITSSSTIIIVSANDDSNIYDAAYESTYYNASNVSSYGAPSECQSAKIRSIFYEDVSECQEISCYVEGPDSECDEESPGHYEAIYEVISPADDDDIVDQNQAEGDLKDNLKDDLKYDLKDDLKDDYLQCPPDDPDLDDSFDSDDSDEAYSRLRPQFADRTELPSSLHREVLRPVSMDSAAMDSKKYLRRKYNRSHSHQPPHHGINKIAEAANLGMKRLRRNWSLTKNEVRTGLNRIKKKSTFSMSDMKSAEDIVNEVGGSSGDKSKWSFKSHFRKKSATLSPLLATTPLNEDGVVGGRRNSKDNATFYLTLTIASERQDASTEEGAEGGGGAEASSSVPSVRDERRRKLSITPSVSSTASSLCETTLTKTRPLSAPGPSLYRNSSTGSNSGTLFRPTNPPPAPPTGTTSPDDDEPALDMSKDRLALRLNQILSAGPIAPPGRRVLRTSESCSSSDVSPVPLLLPPEDKQLLKPLAHVASPKGVAYPRQVFPAPEQGAALTPLSAPRNRGSVASSSSSHGSSEGYIRPSDIATSPPPLPARPTSSSYPPLRRVSTGSGTGTQPSLSSTPGKVQTLLRSPSKTSSLESDSKSYLELNYEAQGSDDPPYISSHFADEPLYQFYTAKVERAALYQGDSSEDDYEVINDGGALITSYLKGGPRPTAMELVTPADGRRTLWCELAEVIGSGILSKISGQERKLQEAMFEVITSEASYLKSLEVLVSHFMNCPEFSREEDPVVSRRDMNVLFSDILPVKKCSELFLGDLEKRWQESVYISGITDVVLKHATSSFNVYVKYCSNQIYQDRKLRHLKENNPRFVDVLFRLETAPVCQSLAMQSFLMLPMQRVTRLPLLIDAIFNRLEYGSSQWQECKVALASLQKIVTECNEAARKMERMEEMLLISHQLDFREVKAIPLISASRWLVKKGELTRLTWREGDNKLTFGRKISKHSLYFFLFTDLLVVTKKKSDDQHMVLDYCPRNMVQVLELESADKFPGRILDGHKNLIIMTMLQNHENKTVEMVLSCSLESDRTRWMEAVTPRISDNPDERIYEEWDCPQVQAIHAYAAQQPDELSLEVSDVFNVLKKTSDGWYQGERLRDGARGWFPGNHTAEIASAHVRARNLRQRYRLLAISGSIVEELKKEKERFEKEEKKKDRRRTITIKEVL